MKKSNEKIYEEFHKTTSIQTHVVSRNNFTYRIIFDVISNFLATPKNILDIGCGAGTISLYLASRGNKVLGIDISDSAVKVCNESAKVLKLNANTTFKTMDFPNEIPVGRYDFIVCSEVLEHIKDDRRAGEKIFSNLRGDGLAIISVPSKNSPLFRLGFAKKFDEQVGHLRRYNLQEMVSLLKRIGFKVLETRKTEGILRNFLFVSRFGGPLVRVANKLTIISDILTFLDSFTLKLFGESQIIVVVQKPEERSKKGESRF